MNFFREQDYRLQNRRISYFISYEDVLNKLKAVQDTVSFAFYNFLCDILNADY